jgi:hypothetical protein
MKMAHDDIEGSIYDITKCVSLAIKHQRQAIERQAIERQAIERQVRFYQATNNSGNLSIRIVLTSVMERQARWEFAALCDTRLAASQNLGDIEIFCLGQAFCALLGFHRCIGGFLERNIHL